jgi:hypothetical protein
MIRFRFLDTVLWLVLTLVSGLSIADAQVQKQDSEQTAVRPITMKGLLDALKIGGLSSTEYIQIIQRSGVDFEMNDGLEKQLQEVGASPELVQVVRKNYRPSTPGNDILTNQSVVDMIAGGLPEDLILTKIRTSKTQFDLSTQALIALNKSGVPTEIVREMMDPKARVDLKRSDDSPTSANSSVQPEAHQPVPHGVLNTQKTISDANDPASPHLPGVYVLLDTDLGRKMALIPPHFMNIETESTGKIFAKELNPLHSMNPFSAGANIPMWVSLPGLDSSIHLPVSNREFYMYFDANENSAEEISMGRASSPDGFALLSFSIKQGKRQAVIGTVNGKGTKDDNRARIPFIVSKIGENAYKIQVNNSLAGGEYGFLRFSLNQYDPRSKMPSAIYDFSVGAY